MDHKIYDYVGVLNDKQITFLAKNRGFIDPFIPENVKEIREPVGKSAAVTKYKALSYGLGSFGYDFRLSPEVYLKVNHTGEVINVKNFNIEEHFEPMKVEKDEYGEYVILPPHSFVLGQSIEYVKMPDDVVAVCFDKSTYARVGGVQTNVTPLEPGWEGTITLEIRNTLPDYTRLYVNEGLIQAVFFKGLKPGINYRNKGGKYQGQDKPTGPKM